MVKSDFDKEEQIVNPMAKFKDNQGTLDYANELIEMFEREKRRSVNVNNMVKEMSSEDVKMEKVKIEMMDEDWDYDQKNTSDKNISEKDSDTMSDGFIGEENGVKFAMVFGKKVFLDLT